MDTPPFPELAAVKPKKTRRQTQESSNYSLNDLPIRFGYYAGLGFAALLFAVASAYLILFAQTTDRAAAAYQALAFKTGDPNVAINVGAHVLAFRTAASLNSCAMVLSMAFCFLGLSLFLIGATKTSDIQGKGQGYEFKAKNMAPGLATIFAASTILIVCIVNRPKLNLSEMKVSTPSQSVKATSLQTSHPGSGKTETSPQSGPAFPFDELNLTPP